MNVQKDSWPLTTTSAYPNTNGVGPLPASGKGGPVHLTLVHPEIPTDPAPPPRFKSVKDLVARMEANPTRKAALIQARKDLVSDPAIANTLSALRLKLGLSQSDLAEIYGTSQAHVARIESGDDLRISTLVKLAAALKVTPSVALEAALNRLQPRE